MMGRAACRVVIGAALASAMSITGCSSGPRVVEARVESPEARFVRARDLNEKAMRAQKAGQTDKAITLYREVVQLAPKMAIAWNNMGVLYMEQQNYVEAGLAFKSAADLVPTDPLPVENLGLMYYRAGYAEKSLTYYLEAIERAPNRAEGYRGAYRASELLGLKDKAALERVEKALLLETDEKWRALYIRKRVWLSNEPGNLSAAK